MKHGIEAFAEVAPIQHEMCMFHFLLYIFDEGCVHRCCHRHNGENTDISGHEVERFQDGSVKGLNLGYKNLRAVLQYSYVAKSFQIRQTSLIQRQWGERPCTILWYLDLNMSFVLRIIYSSRRYQHVRIINFTKRPLFYPGPEYGLGWA